MKIEVELPEKYAEKLEEAEEVDPTIREQIEIEVLPEVLRLINDAHRQAQQQGLSLAEGEGMADAGVEDVERE